MKNYTLKAGVLRNFGLPPKLLLIMRLVIVILFTSLMQVSASSLAQRITLSEKNASMEQVLKKIKLQTGFDVLYGSEVLNKARKVTVNISDLPVQDALATIFEEQPLDYQLKDNTIFITHKTPGFLETVIARFTAIDVRGKVIGENDEVLIGATVKVKGTNKETKTDGKGEFYLQNVEEGATIVISYLGYVSKEVRAEKEMGTVKLRFQNNDLQEVTINKGYYTEKKRLTTGNVSVVSGETIAKQPVNNFVTALQGRVPGLYISESSGIPGSAMNIRLRGQNSIENGNEPLFIIDGVPFGSKSLYDGLNLQTRAVQSMSPLFAISPSDIENIEVLKDADATAIYGSRGANGVILITTKKGKTNKTTVSANFYHGMTRVSNKLKLLNTTEYLAMRREAFKNDGTSPTTTDYDLNGTWDTTRYTDWQELLIGNTGRVNDANITLAGGSVTTRFSLRGGYRKETNIYPGDFSDVRGSAHANVNHMSQNNKFHADLSFSYSSDNNRQPIADFVTSILLAPNAPAIYNSDGSFNWANSSWSNPMAPAEQTNSSLTNNLNSSLNISYNPISWLTIGSLLGYNDMRLKSVNILPLSANNPAISQDPSGRRNSFGYNAIRLWNIEPTASVEFKVGKSKFNGLIGGKFEESSADGVGLRATGFSSDVLIPIVTAATTITTTGMTGYIYRYNAIYGRLAWNYQDKYIVNLTARRDGSSNFGPDKRFGNFGAAGVAWIFSEEEFGKNLLPILTFGKIRASYGIAGNDQMNESYRYLSTYTTLDVSYQGGTSLSPAWLTNPNYGWETVKKLEVALDLGFFNDRMNLSTSWYRNRTGNQLVDYGLPYITGFASIKANLPAVVQNTGLEFDFSSKNIVKKNFKWTTNANISFPDNKLISFPGLATSSYSTQYFINQPLTIRNRYNYIGIDATTGIYTFEDINGDGQITNTFDRRPIFVGQKFFGSLGNSFTYKGIELDVFFQFVNQTGYKWTGAVPGRFFGATSNIDKSTLDELRDGKIQKLTASSSTPAGRAFTNYNQSNGPVTDASFIRLKNVALSWNLPTSLLSPLKIDNLRIYMQGQNLLTFTKYKSLDPETAQTAAANVVRLPVLRTFTVGAQMNF